MNGQSASVLFGKLPSRGDFVRSGPRGTAEHAFEEWLARAVEFSGGALPSTALRFVVAPPDGDGSLVGAWVPSRDEVGRGFPLALLQRLPDDVACVPWSVVPAHYESYLEQSERCLERALQQPLDWLKGAVARLELPHPSALPGRWHQARRALGELSVAAFAARVFAPSAVDPLAYALCTLRRAAALADEEITLDLPSTCATDTLAWLELLRSLLGQERRPSALLWAAGSGRLLASLGEISPRLIAFLQDPQHRSSRRWPVWTESAAAGELARAELSEGERRLLLGGASLSDLIDAVRSARSS